MTTSRRIIPDRCCAAIIDVQPFFLSQMDKRLRARLKINIGNFAELIGYYRIPLVVTLERPVDGKGALPRDIEKRLHAGR